MAFVAVATSVGAAVLGTGAAAGIGSAIVGGALIGAGVGGLYSAITGDGDILNSMLTGGLIGGAGAGIGSAMTAAPTVAPTATGLGAPGAAATTVSTTTPALTAAQATAAEAAIAGGETTAGMIEANAVNTAAAEAAKNAALTKTAALTGKEMLGYGLAGTGAMQLLGNKKPGLSGGAGDPGMIRPYTFSPNQTATTGIYPSPYATAQYDAAGMPIMDTRERNYFDQKYTALTPYSARAGTENPNKPIGAAAGGLMAIGGPVERMSQNVMGGQGNMFPLSQQEHTNFATPTQMPASAEVIRSDYDAKTQPYTGVMMANGGQVKRYAAGGGIDMGNGYNPFANLPPMSGPLGALGGPVDPNTVRPNFAAMQAAMNGTNTTTTADMMGEDRRVLSFLKGGLGAQGIDPTTIYYGSNMDSIGQPTGQSTYPSATAMQGGFGQGAQGYPSFSSSSGGGAGAGGPFPLEGQYGIIKMANGGKSRSNKDDDNFSFDDLTKAQKEYYLDLMASPMKGEMPLGSNIGSENTLEKYMMSQAPQGFTGRIGATRVNDDGSNLRAGLSGIAMAQPGKPGITAIPGAYDVGYRSPRKSDEDSYLDLSAYRSINSVPGRGYDRGVNARYTIPFADGGDVMGYDLGGYSDGGRLLRGPGDGVSDDIPATIAGKQPARLADGEFVIPARIVSEIGNGSTDAGAKRLYAMMDKIQAGRKKTIGKKNIAKDTKAKKHLLA
jgi:hypothetical protein